MRANLLFGAAGAALLMMGGTPAAKAQVADQPGDASTQAQLTTTQEGELAPAGDVDWYRLHVERGMRYAIALEAVDAIGAGGFDTTLGIYDAAGVQLAFNDDSNASLNSALLYTPSQSSEVFVEARAYSEEATGRYRLSVSAAAAPADDAGNDAATRARATVGRPAMGALEYDGDVDWYRFNARTGQRYSVSLAAEGASGALADPVLRIVDRDGNEIAANDDNQGSLNSFVSFSTQRSGDVFIEAGGFGGAQTGAYTLNIAAEALPTDIAADTATTRARIITGQSISSDLGYANDSDWYRIRLEAGQAYRFTLVSAGETPLSDPILRIHGADEEELAMDDDGGEGFNSYLEFAPTTTGNYFIEARGFGEDATGGYTLNAASGDIPGDATTDASLSTDGDYREGTLAPAGDRDWYRVNLAEGQGLRIGLTSAEAGDALGDPMLVFYGSDGSELGRDDDGGDGLNSWMEFQATAAGPYYIEARGFTDDGQGRYVLSLTAGEIGNSAEGAEYLAPNGDGRTSVIGADGDADWFVVEMIEGRPYRFTVEGVEPGALADPKLTLYDAEGREVASDDDGGTGLNSYLGFASTSGGPYFAAVSAFNEGGTGRYLLRVADTDVPGHANTDEFLDSSSDQRLSRVDMPGDLDYYRVELEAGVRYGIEVSGAGDNPLADPFLALMNEQNERVTSDDDSGDGLDARVVFAPEEAGVYFIQASGLGGSAGSYQVSIVRQ
jgi:hypothetical protein